MKQDVMTALREMRKVMACILVELGKLFVCFAGIVLFTAALIGAGWMLVNYTLYTLSVLVAVIVCGWFYVEYTTARDIRIWDEMCQVNKGKTK